MHRNRIVSAAIVSALWGLPAPGMAGMEAPNLTTLVEQSTRVVRGRIHIAETALETVPLNDQGDVARMVFTYAEVEPVEHLVGKPVSKLTLRLIGERLGDSAVLHDEAPAIHSGEDVVLFLRPSQVPRSSTGESVYFLPHARYGKFGVTTAGGVASARRAVINRSLGTLGDVDADSRSVALDVLRAHVVHTARTLGMSE